ncbi:Glycine cleavage system H protein 5 [Magnetospirillum sp. LM-5]|uniref:glycine cleavage system protein H n=1 Tax=Magnetospirillum sp. LM-5 TaxID=2681466 RepID=UPI001385A2B5|nr:glycine cleavage system protein H [Magnetospirillum sp. LM-5]CAA7623438.1 Glycine cleavage system H protein 5 [Magnetospirillum sp. LM-5]
MAGTWDFPPDRFYDAGRHMWFREEAPGCFRVGITAQGAKVVGDLVAFMPKRVGGRVETGRSVATVESGKWVGAVRLPFAGLVLEANEAPIDRPELINQDPFGQGWMVVVQADEPEATRSLLESGQAGCEGP